MQVECILIILKIKEGKHAGIILIYKFITGKVGYGYYKKWGWQVFIGGYYTNVIGYFYRGGMSGAAARTGVGKD